MMQLKDILEPGERLLAQDPAAPIPWFVQVIAVAWLVAFVVALMQGNLVLILIVGAGSGAVLFLDRWKPDNRPNPWTSAISDRRLIWRPDADSHDYKAAPLAKVKLAGMSSGMPDEWRIAVRHNDRIFGFAASRRTTRRIRKALESAQGAA